MRELLAAIVEALLFLLKEHPSYTQYYRERLEKAAAARGLEAK